MFDNQSYADTDLYTGCGNCEDICPADAIMLIDGRAEIDYDMCAGCRLCQHQCPSEAIC